MPLTGYQDWQRTTVQSGYPVIAVNQAVTAGTWFAGGSVQDWAFLNFSAYTPAGSDIYQVVIEWYTDAAYANVIFTDVFNIQSDGESAFPVPVMGPYMRMYVYPKAGNNATVIQVTLYGAMAYASAFDMGQFAGPLIADNSAYAANGSKTFYVFHTYPGRAILQVNSAVSQTTHVYIHYYDFASNSFLLAYASNGNYSAVPLLIEIGMAATQYNVQVVNGATAGNCVTSLTAVP